MFRFIHRFLLAICGERTSVALPKGMWDPPFGGEVAIMVIKISSGFEHFYLRQISP